mmetsp:Transcript_72031/g.187831  ORF Transcript_72031/g.187831 Transcript_72031/m.187831 type:complete len:276 (+) Transcript_72031:430-1257(+)
MPAATCTAHWILKSLDTTGEDAPSLAVPAVEPASPGGGPAEGVRLSWSTAADAAPPVPFEKDSSEMPHTDSAAQAGRRGPSPLGSIASVSHTSQVVYAITTQEVSSAPCSHVSVMLTTSRAAASSHATAATLRAPTSATATKRHTTPTSDRAASTADDVRMPPSHCLARRDPGATLRASVALANQTSFQVYAKSISITACTVRKTADAAVAAVPNTLRISFGTKSSTKPIRSTAMNFATDAERDAPSTHPPAAIASSVRKTRTPAASARYTSWSE